MSTSVYLALAVLGAYALKRALSPRLPAPLPPGPKGLPILGNVLDWPKERAWEVFTAWGETYGDMVYANLAGQHAVILNDAELALELLDRKGVIYSDRPSMYMSCELVRWKNVMTLMPYSKSMREQRDLITRTIGSKAALATYESMMTAEVQRFIGRVLDEPNRLSAHVRILSGSIILSIAFGYIVQDGDSDEFVNLGTKLMHEFGDASMPGRYIVDILPVIDRLPSWFPGLGYRKVATQMRETQDKFLDKPYEYVQSQLSAGTARPSFVAAQIDKTEVSPELESRVKWASAALWGGGADTTVSAMCTFFLAMTLHPEVQARAQAEIDSVLGPENLPTIADRSRLPFVEAILWEVLRWGQVGPQGLPHVSQQDDVHRGYLIPKGTIVIANIWKFAHDPKTYNNPMKFDPARFLKTDSHMPELDPREFTFGYGRRVCVGQQLAEHSVWLTCALSLATLTVSKSSRPDGTPITPNIEYVGQLITHPQDFPCTIKARSPKAEALIRDALHNEA